MRFVTPPGAQLWRNYTSWQWQPAPHDPSPPLDLEADAGGAVTGTGELVAQDAALAGDGTSESASTVGALIAQNAAVSGAGTSLSTGSGALSAQAAVVAGTGDVTGGEVTGTGALQAQAALIAGVGDSGSAGTGELAAQEAFVASVGSSGSDGVGALEAQSASVVGVDVPTETAAAPRDGARWPPLRSRRHRRLRRAKQRKLHPEEIVRQQRMVQEYLDSLERKAQEPKQQKAPRFTPALARAAADAQISNIARIAALAHDRELASDELWRRQVKLVLLLALD